MKWFVDFKRRLNSLRSPAPAPTYTLSPVPAPAPGFSTKLSQRLGAVVPLFESEVPIPHSYFTQVLLVEISGQRQWRYASPVKSITVEPGVITVDMYPTEVNETLSLIHMALLDPLGRTVSSGNNGTISACSGDRLHLSYTIVCNWDDPKPIKFCGSAVRPVV